MIRRKVKCKQNYTYGYAIAHPKGWLEVDVTSTRIAAATGMTIAEVEALPLVARLDLAKKIDGSVKRATRVVGLRLG